MKWLAILLLAAACSGRPSAGDCAKAADHMIDIMTAPTVGEGGTAPQEAVTASEAWKKAFKEKDPTRDAMINGCRSKMTGSHVSCILAATDELALAKCFGT